MTSLPTCWYCPECGDGPAPRGFKHLRGDDGSDTICPGTHVKCVVIPPGTPLTVILDTLGIEYRAIEQNCVLMAFDEHGNGVDSWDNSVLIVDIRATDEAHDG